MKRLIGAMLVVFGIILGLYVGIWVCFIGGIVDVIEQVRAPIMSSGAIAWGIAKVMFAGLFGYLSAAFCIIPGWAILNDL